VRFQVTASDDTAPTSMALIPAGSFTMGDTFNEGRSVELPLHSVYVSAFYMDRTEVTKASWDEVYHWAIAHSYSFDNPGSGKGATHPVHSVNWHDAVKWCNARSEKEGRIPAYYTSAGQTDVYRSGEFNVDNTWVKWDRGYRLPTEAEWEKAARGGSSGLRFPWGNTITHSQANYYSSSDDAYDTSPTRGPHPTFQTGNYPSSSPVGYFAANGYGLFDLAGNVLEWCWDRFGNYGGDLQTDPRGPSSGLYIVFRGGSSGHTAHFCRPTYRDGRVRGDNGNGEIGFRSVLPLGQP